MKDDPLFSIVMPCYEQVRFLEPAVRSVLDQTNIEVELLVFDPGSADGSKELLYQLHLEYGKKLQLFFEIDSGQSDAVNKGMKKANGTFLGWLNSDDLLRPGALSRVTPFLSDSKPAWVYGRAGIIDENGAPVSNIIRKYKNWRGRKFSRLRLLTENFIPQMSVFWNKAIWEQVGGLATDKHLDMDYDLWLRFANVVQPAIIDEELADFRVHSQAKGSTKTAQQLDAALLTAKNHSKKHGILGVLALLIHSILGWRTRLIYQWIKPK